MRVLWWRAAPHQFIKQSVKSKWTAVCVFMPMKNSVTHWCVFTESLWHRRRGFIILCLFVCLQVKHNGLILEMNHPTAGHVSVPGQHKHTQTHTQVGRHYAVNKRWWKNCFLFVEIHQAAWAGGSLWMCVCVCVCVRASIHFENQCEEWGRIVWSSLWASWLGSDGWDEVWVDLGWLGLLVRRNI